MHADFLETRIGLVNVRKFYFSTRRDWLAMPFRKQYIASLEQCVHIDAPYDNAVCLALRDFGTAANPDMASFTQPLVFLDVVSYLENHVPGQKPLQLVAQDPCFRPLDVALFRSLGVKVVQDPEATSYITPNTFLFTPCIPQKIFIEEIMPHDFAPALYIGPNLDELLNTEETTLDEDDYETREEYEIESRKLREHLQPFRDKLIGDAFGSIAQYHAGDMVLTREIDYKDLRGLRLWTVDNRKAARGR